MFENKSFTERFERQRQEIGSLSGLYYIMRDFAGYARPLTV
jgi:hypothetical protein